MSEVPWGEMPYDKRAVADVIYDYAVIRGDLTEQYARDQLSNWIERLVRQRQAEAWDRGFVARLGDTPRYKTRAEWGNPYAAPTTDQPGRVSGDERGDQR